MRGMLSEKQRRYLAALKQFGCGASQNQLADTAMTVGAHHKQIDFLGVDILNYSWSGLPMQHLAS